MRNLISIIISGLITVSALPAVAKENYAILIGASTYENLKEKYWLKGPANDVTLVAQYLTTTAPIPFDPDNVTLLADGVEGGQKPTLDAIRKGFAQLTAKLQPDDFVYLHFSGHGTQAPALNPDTELDGLDELFLPVDIGPWSDKTGFVENALVDDEIGQLIGAMRAKGASVWAVFDSCHSGTVTRAAPTGDDEVRMRKLTSDALGIPQDMMDAAETKSRALPNPRTRPQSPAGDAMNQSADAGKFIAFYAAQTNETTPEKNMPKGQPGRKLQGVFTYTIFETLAANAGLTYRQLGQEVLRKYSVKNLALSTPMFEGDLDAIVFSGQAAGKIQQWPAKRQDEDLHIPAGNLQNVNQDDILALLPTAASSTDQVIGYFQVSNADTFSADLVPVAFNDIAAMALDDVPKGTYLRRFQDEVDFSLTVALPDLARLPEDLTQITGALDYLKSDDELGQRIEFVAAGQPADIRLAIVPESTRPDALWMLPSSGFFEKENATQIPSVGTQDKTAKELATVLHDNLSRMSKAINLLKIGGSYDDLDLGVDITLRTKSKKNKKLRALDTSNVPVLIPDDQVHVLAKNTEEFPIDINVLHIGSDYAITHFFSGRLQPGDTLKKGLFAISDTAFGRDRVIMVASPAEPQSITENLSFLEQDALQISRGTNTSAASSLSSVLSAAGFGATTRGAVPLDDDDSGPTAAIIQFELDTVPGG